MSLRADTPGLPRQRPLPWYFLLLALMAAVAMGLLITELKILLIVAIVSAAAFFLVRAFVDPWFAIACATVLYPFVKYLVSVDIAYGSPIQIPGYRYFPELLQAIILLHLIVRLIMNRRKEGVWFRITADDLPAAAYVFIALYSFVIGWINIHPLCPINGWMVSITPAVWYLLIRWLRPTKEQIRRQFRVIIGTYVALAIPSLIEYIVRPSFSLRVQNAIRPDFVPKGMPPMAFWHMYPRMQSLLIEENCFGAISELVAVFCVAQLMQARPRWQIVPLFLLSSVCMALTMSRGAFLSFVIALSVLLLIQGRHRPRILAGIAAVGILVSTALLFVHGFGIGKSMLERLSTVSVNAASGGQFANDRTGQWDIAWQIFLGTPSGKGLGTVGFGAGLSEKAPMQVVDGLFFRLLAEQGCPGVLAFLFTIFGIGWVLRRYVGIVDEEIRPLVAGMLAFHVGWSFHSIGGSTFDFYYVAPMYWMSLGLCMSAIHLHLAERSARRALPWYDASNSTANTTDLSPV